MKKLYPLLIAVIFSAIAYNAQAQSGFSDIIKISPDDATKLLQAYGQPLFKGFGVGMNSGWTNTAKPKKLLHFDLRITASAAFTPNSDKSFDVSKLGLHSVSPADPNQTITPTIGGDRNNDGPTLNINSTKNSPNGPATVTLPRGYLPVIPFPQVQLTVGLIERTDLTVRFIPNIKVGDNVGSINMIGFGLKHDLTKYMFGTAGRVVPFDLSVLFAYSRLNLNAALNVQPDEGATPENGSQQADFSNQRSEAHFSSFLAEAILSKKLLFFTPFVAVGYNTASTNLAAVGNYPVTTGNNGTNDTYTVYTNPVTIKETSISGFRADVGFQLNLGIRVFASASLAQYKSVNAGIGFGF
ncbi:MAG: hypothetical protein M3O71_20305 [Bacteroidota bacterium]|nr:hypothetical protein [Bacteroidota bacterium]